MNPFPKRKSILDLPGSTTVFSHIPEGHEEGPCETVMLERKDGERTIHVVLFLEPFRIVNNSFCRDHWHCSSNANRHCECAIEDVNRYTARQLNIQSMVAENPENTPLASIERLCNGMGWLQ